MRTDSGRPSSSMRLSAWTPTLTSVASYPNRTGAEAADLLRRRMDDPDLPPRTVLLAPELHVRQSTVDPVARHEGGRL